MERSAPAGGAGGGSNVLETGALTRTKLLHTSRRSPSPPGAASNTTKWAEPPVVVTSARMYPTARLAGLENATDIVFWPPATQAAVVAGSLNVTRNSLSWQEQPFVAALLPRVTP